MGLALARQSGGRGVFTLHAFNELLSSDSPTVTYKAHIPPLMMHGCMSAPTWPFGAPPPRVRPNTNMGPLGPQFSYWG